jgi:hypothetical protein
MSARSLSKSTGGSSRGKSSKSLASVADEIEESGSSGYSDNDDFDDLDDDDVSPSKAVSRLMQSSPGRLSSKKGKGLSDLSLSVEDAAEVLRKASDKSLFGRLFTTQANIQKKMTMKMTKTISSKDKLKRLNEMSKPRQQKKGNLGYATEDERINMNWKKKTKKKVRGRDDDHETKENDGEKDFMDRMEAKERKRRENLARKRGEKDYEVMIDKKVCPNCGAIQSYDEVVSRRKKCKKSGCNVFYQKPGMKDDKQFLRRLEKMQVETSRKRRELEKKHTPKFCPESRTMFDPEEGKIVTLPYQSGHGDFEGFLARMKDAEEKKRQRMLAGGVNEAPISAKSAMF